MSHNLKSWGMGVQTDPTSALKRTVFRNIAVFIKQDTMRIYWKNLILILALLFCNFRDKRFNASIYTTRVFQNYSLPKCRLQLYKTSFVPTVISEWNTFPEEIRDAPSLKRFSQKIISYVNEIKNNHPPEYFYLRCQRRKGSLRPSVRPSQNLVIATPLKLLIQLSRNLVCR